VGHKSFSGAKTKDKAKDEAGRKTLYVISNQIRPGSTVKAHLYVQETSRPSSFECTSIGLISEGIYLTLVRSLTID